VNPETPLTASLFWSRDGRSTSDPANLVEQKSVEVLVRFPATFQINVFEAPQLAATNATTPYRVGLILVYEDVNANAAFDAGELRGGASFHALLYTDRTLSDAESPTGRRLDPGFSLVSLPLPCESVPPAGGDDPADCGVPLGAPCAGPETCGALGDCVFVDYTESYCVLPAENTTCTPQGGVLLGYLDQNEVARDIWIKGCTTDDDCREEHECEAWIGACLPKAPVYLDIVPEFEPVPLCEADF
jgi:hypothetical protein